MRTIKMRKSRIKIKMKRKMLRRKTDPIQKSLKATMFPLWNIEKSENI